MRMRCPKCRSVFEPAGPDAAGLIQCPECGQRLKWRPPAQAAAPKSAPPKAAAPKGPAADMAPVRLVGSKPGRPMPMPRKKMSPGLLAGLIVGGTAAAAMAGVLIYVAVSRNGSTPTPPPVAVTPPTTPTTPETPGPAPTTPETPTTPTTPETPVTPPTPAAVTSTEPMQPADLFKRVSPAVVRIDVMNEEYKQRGQGSGFVVSPDGLIVTNHHVIHLGLRGFVRFGDNRALPVTAILAQDKDKDLAVIKIHGRNMPYVELLPEGEKPNVGDPAFAIGTPSGFTNTLSQGLVSGLREQDDRSVVQTTAEIGSGSSGGPLLDTRGRVIGVNTYVRRAQGPGHIVENLNFAVAGEEVHAILNKARAARDRRVTHEGRPLDEQAGADLTRAYEKLGEDQLLDAAGIVKDLAERFPDNTQVCLLQARISMRMNFMDDALKAFEAAARLDPNEPEAHLGIGLVHVRNKEWQEAADALRKAVDLVPEDPVAQRILGTALLEVGRTDDALNALKEAVRIDDEDGKAWMRLGEAYLAEELWDGAEDAFKKVVALNPKNAKAFANLALAIFRSGRAKQAAGFANTAVRLRPDLPLAYYVVALITNKTGQKKPFRQARQRLQELDPELAKQLADEIGQGPAGKPDTPDQPDEPDTPEEGDEPAEGDQPDMTPLPGVPPQPDEGDAPAPDEGGER